MDDFDNCIWTGDISRSSATLTIRCTHTKHHQQPDWDGVCDGQVIFDGASKQIKYIQLESRAVAVFHRVATAPESAESTVAESEGGESDEGPVAGDGEGDGSDGGDGEGDGGDGGDGEGDGGDGSNDEGDGGDEVRANNPDPKEAQDNIGRDKSAVEDDVDIEMPKGKGRMEEGRMEEGRIESDASTPIESEPGDDTQDDELYEDSGSVRCRRLFGAHSHDATRIHLMSRAHIHTLVYL